MQPGEVFRDEYLVICRKLDRMRAIRRNRRLSSSDKCILMAVDELYPDLMRMRIPVQVWKIAKEAGVAPKSVTRFFQAMWERGYIDYQVKRTQDKTGQYSSEVSVQALEAWNKPGELNTRDALARREHRKKIKERLVCRNCGSVEFRAVLQCTHCGKELGEDQHV